MPNAGLEPCARKSASAGIKVLVSAINSWRVPALQFQWISAPSAPSDARSSCWSVNQSTAAALFERAVTGVLDDGADGLIADGHLLKAIHRTPVRQERVFQSHGSLQNSDKRAHKTKHRRFDGLKLIETGVLPGNGSTFNV